MSLREASIIVVLAYASSVQALQMEWITIGDPGNVADTRYESPGYGGVADTYKIGKYEVTNSQHAEFLNTVDPEGRNPHDLYNSSMGISSYGGISFDSGAASGSKYAVRSGRGDKPVNYVSWYDTLRFANWMHNGQGSGDTEDGAYDMLLGSSVVRKPGARVWLPSEDEWYKAAYYRGGGTNAGYWKYPTQSDMAPTDEAPAGTDLVNGSANYNNVLGDMTDVGSYTAKPSDSAYGTFDQGGNLWEWNEADIYGDGSYRGVRGGYFDSLGVTGLHAAYRYGDYPSYEYNFDVGFRVAEVPEPAALSLLFLGGLLVLRPRRR